jgi:tetratricopeptide (TPR) repeat protein
MIATEDLDDHIKEIKYLVSEGKITGALNKLQLSAKAVDLEREAIHLSHFYNSLRTKEIKGIIDSKEISIENSKLVDSILGLCDMIQAKREKGEKRQRKVAKIVVPILMGFVLLSICIFLLLGRINKNQLLERIGSMQLSKAASIDTFSIRFPISSNDVRFGGRNPLPKADLALSQFQSKQHTEEVPDINIIPNLSSLEYFKLGMTYRQSNMLEKALAYFTRSILEDNTFVNAFVERGITYRILEQYEEALNDYTSAIDIDHSIAQIYVNRSVVYFMLEMYDLAEEDCMKASQLDTSIPELYLSMGNTYLGKKRYQESISAFEKALQLKNFYANAIYGLSFAYYSIGDAHKYCKLVEEFRKLEGSTFTTAFSSVLCEEEREI